jgi:hypothetical protein
MAVIHGAAPPLDNRVLLDFAETDHDGEVDPKLFQAFIGSVISVSKGSGEPGLVPG